MPEAKIRNALTGKVIFSCSLPNVRKHMLSREAVKLAIMLRSNLNYANLACADLRKVNFNGVSLYGASLYNADLRQANLTGVNLTKADLANANLQGANLRNVHLNSANISTTCLIDGGCDSRGYRFWAWKRKDGRVIYRAGCREWSDFPKALKHYGDFYDSSGDKAECISRLHLLHICAASRGWINLTQSRSRKESR